MDTDERMTYSTSQKSDNMHHTKLLDSPPIIMSQDKVNFGFVHARRFHRQEGTMKPLSVSELNANHIDDVWVLSL